MAHTKQDLIDSIKEMKAVYHDADTPENIKASIKSSLDNAEKLLHELEAAEKKTATPAEKEEKPTAKEIAKAVEKGETKVEKAKAAEKKTVKKKAPVVKMTPKQKDSLRSIVASAAKYAKYHGHSEASLKRDAARKAKQPGSRTSASGKKYREYRANRSDVNKGAPHLAKGGKLPKDEKVLLLVVAMYLNAYRTKHLNSKQSGYHNINDIVAKFKTAPTDYGNLNHAALFLMLAKKDYTDPKQKKVLEEKIEELSEMAKKYMGQNKLAAGGPIGEGKNGYIAFYKGKQLEVMADTSYQAQQRAAAHFKAKKSYDVSVVLAEKEGEQVTHTPDFAHGGETGGIRFIKIDIQKGDQIEFGTYKTTAFTPAAKAAFEKAIAELETEDKESPHYRNASQAMGVLLRLVDSLLTSNSPENVHGLLQSVGIYNYKTGLLLDTHWLNKQLEERHLAEGGAAGKPVIKVKPVEPYSGLYSDPNGDEYFRSEKGTLYSKNGRSGEWHSCTPSGEPDIPITRSEMVVVEKFARGGRVKHNSADVKKWIYEQMEHAGIDVDQFKEKVAQLKFDLHHGSDGNDEDYQGWTTTKNQVDEMIEQAEIPSEIYYDNFSGAISESEPTGGYEDEETGEWIEEGGDWHRVDTRDVLLGEVAEYRKKGGRLKSAINRDRKYKSDEPWEQAYHRRSRPVNPRYKMAKGGVLSKDDYEKFRDKKVFEIQWHGRKEGWGIKMKSGYIRKASTYEDAIAEFEDEYGKLGEAKAINKQFIYRDHSGRGIKSKLDEQHIRENWDLSNVNEDNDQELEDFLDNCEIGDEWHDGPDELICSDDGSEYASGGRIDPDEDYDDEDYDEDDDYEFNPYEDDRGGTGHGDDSYSDADPGLAKGGGVDKFSQVDNSPLARKNLHHIYDTYMDRRTGMMIGDKKDYEKGHYKKLEDMGLITVDKYPGAYSARITTKGIQYVDGGLKKGGRIKSAVNRDRKYKSDEPWEQDYKRKTSPKNPRYNKMFLGGPGRGTPIPIPNTSTPTYTKIRKGGNRSKAAGGKLGKKMNARKASQIAKNISKQK